MYKICFKVLHIIDLLLDITNLLYIYYLKVTI